MTYNVHIPDKNSLNYGVEVSCIPYRIFSIFPNTKKYIRLFLTYISSRSILPTRKENCYLEKLTQNYMSVCCCFE